MPPGTATKREHRTLILVLFNPILTGIMARSDPDTISQAVLNLRVLLLDALQAGLFLPDAASWRPHYSGEILYFADRAFGLERPAVLVLAELVTGEIVAESTDNDFRSYIVVGGRLGPGVDLGKGHSTRIARMANTGENYWATFVLEDALLVAHGTPLSWCRLVGEVLNAQISTPFVQRKICGKCHGINTYYARDCESCGQALTLTTRFGR